MSENIKCDERCEHCLWFVGCRELTYCEYFYSTRSEARRIRSEYEESLAERVRDYQEIIDELK